MQQIGAGPRRCLAIRVLASWLAFGTVFVALVPETEAAAKKDPREKQAKHAFTVGRFDEALELFASLYADTSHPTYLRNIGRCYQNLKHTPRPTQVPSTTRPARASCATSCARRFPRNASPSCLITESA